MNHHSNQDQGPPHQDPNMVLPYNTCKQVEGEMVSYKECLKNHAASIGGNAIDGCGEFIGDPFDALKCSACGCHRNFHRKELEGESSRHPSSHYNNSNIALGLTFGRKNEVSGGVHHKLGLFGTSPNTGGGVSTPSESNDHGDGDGDGDGFFVRPVQRKKRFRTKFSHEQKEKLIAFAEKAGWKMQKLDESVVQQFCQEIGIKRKVLKVWMHNNKHHYVHKDLHF